MDDINRGSGWMKRVSIAFLITFVLCFLAGLAYYEGMAWVAPHLGHGLGREFNHEGVNPAVCVGGMLLAGWALSTIGLRIRKSLIRPDANGGEG